MNKKGKGRARQDDALNEALRDVADELAAVPGSPSPSPTKQGLSFSIANQSRRPMALVL
jgi:hypothetical protein